MTPRARMPTTLTLRAPRPSLGSRASSQNSLRCMRSSPCTSASPSPSTPAIERQSYFSTTTAAAAAAGPSPSTAEISRATTSTATAAAYQAGSNQWKSGNTSSPGMNTSYFATTTTNTTTTAPATAASTASPQDHAIEYSPRIQHSGPIPIARPPQSTNRRTPEPLTARGFDNTRGGYFFPFQDDTPPSATTTTNTTKAHEPDDVTELTSRSYKARESPAAEGFFINAPKHTTVTSTTSTTTTTTSSSLHHHQPRRPSLRPAPPRTTTFLSTMAIAQGKYHPSNYRNPSAPGSIPLPPSSSSSYTATQASAPPTAQDATSAPTSSPFTTTTTSGTAQATNPTSTYPPHPSPADTRRLLLQYQRDMVEAAARAAQMSVGREPASPRLGPLGSPGPVTPWELEGEAAGGGGWLDRKVEGAEKGE